MTKRAKTVIKIRDFMGQILNNFRHADAVRHGIFLQENISEKILKNTSSRFQCYSEISVR